MPLQKKRSAGAMTSVFAVVEVLKSEFDSSVQAKSLLALLLAKCTHTYRRKYFLRKRKFRRCAEPDKRSIRRRES